MYNLMTDTDLAEELMAQKAPCYLSRDGDILIEHVADELRLRFGTRPQEALCMAMRAFARQEALQEDCEATIDLDNTSSSCLFIRSGGITHALSVAELGELLERVPVRRLDAGRRRGERAGLCAGFGTREGAAL